MNRKEVIQSIVLAFISCAVMYLAIAFVRLEIDFRMWEKEDRLCYAATSLLLLIISPMIIKLIHNK